MVVNPLVVARGARGHLMAQYIFEPASAELGDGERRFRHRDPVVVVTLDLFQLLGDLATSLGADRFLSGRPSGP